MTSGAANLIGFIGTACIVGAYAYNNAASRVNPFLYNGVNLLGAILLALSLTVNRNLPSLVLEFIWMAIALYGLAKALRQRAS